MTMKAIWYSLILLLYGSRVIAQWSSDPSVNTRVTNGGLLPQIITDGAGGAYIVYQDSPALLRQLWVQWLDRYGVVRFPDNGIRVSSEDRSQTPRYFLVSDNTGGVIIVFEDFQVIGEETFGAVYAQRIDSTGAKLWGEAGIEISPPADDKGPVSACSDGEHGVFVFWGEDADSSGAFELWAQRVSADGEPLWPGNGVVITEKFTSFNVSEDNPAVSDENGGAFILYADSTGRKLHHINAQSEFSWGASIDPRVGGNMVSDLRGGIIIAGMQFVSASESHVVAQRVDAHGQVLWGDQGVVITQKADNQTFRVEIAVDEWGNSLIVWRDRRTGRFEVYAQRLSAGGNPLWEPDGVALSEFDSQKSLNGNGIAPTPDGNNVYIWRDRRIEDGGLFGQRLDSAGLRLWGKNDIPISVRDHFQNEHKVISDLAGGAIVCWYEVGTGSGFGIFAQQVSRNGNLGEVLATSVSQPDESSMPTQYILHQSYPNPFNAGTIVKYEIPESKFVTLVIYDIKGNEVIALINEKQPPGAYQVNWNGKNQKGGDVASGIYFYQLRAGNFVQTKKTLLIR